MPFAVSEGLPGLVAGAARIASPFRIYNWPEQYNLDRWNLTPSESAPGARNIPNLGEVDPATGELTPAGERAQFVDSAARYGATATPEARHLANLQNEYYALEPLDYAEANDLAGKLYGIHNGESDETVTIGGVEYTPEDIRAMPRGDLYHLGTQALADAGYSREQQAEIKDAQARFLADHPEYAGYKAFQELVGYSDAEKQAFVTETAMTNPGYAQFVRSSLMNHETGQIDYGSAGYVDSYLASQGTRPSVYSPLVGNEPSRVPGGYPELAGHPSGQPLLPQMTQAASEPFTIYTKPLDPNEYVYPDEVAGAIDPALAERVEVIAGPDSEFGMVKVRIGDQIGYVDQAFLASTSPPQPSAAPGPAPVPVQPQGGLAGLAGGVVSALGGAKDAIQGAFGGSAGPGMTPAAPQESRTTTTPSGPFTIDTTTYAGTPNRSDRSAPPEGIVYHYTAGSSIDEFIADFMGETGRDASSNYIVDKDGTIYELIDPDQAAWTHGDTSNPRTDLPWLAEQIAAGYNLNDRAIGIEIVNEGNRDGDFVPYTPEQIAAVTWLTQVLVDRYGITPSRDRLLGHSDINTTGKFDPGPLFPLDDIIAAA
jgi:N-acetyl-anhydromuramyl-L-alanine amidase AmpD